MKYIKSYIFLTLMVVSLVGCKVDDLKDDVNDLKDRVALIEEQVNLLNSNLEAVAYVLDSQNRTINSVDDAQEGKYIITLSDGSELVLTTGKEGVVKEPVITIGEDNNWYINGQPTGVPAVGKLGANGQGVPEFRVNNGNWEVRFNGGEWKPVEGGTGVATGSLGDQFFDSAKVEGDVFVVTMIDGSTYHLPIVKDLVCSIVKEGAGEDGFFTLEKGERKAFTVTVKGDNPTLTYPAGWRATLSTPDSEGQAELMVYAPVEFVSLASRAAADNASDVTIRVQKGAFWAVDKIKVKTPKVYNNDWDKYNDGVSVEVGGLDINKQTYGEATLVSANQDIEKGGVYFVDTDNVTLTYNNNEDIESLVILPKTDAVKNVSLEVKSSIMLKKGFICKGIKIHKSGSNNLIGAKAQGISFILDRCLVVDDISKKAWISSSNGATLAYFSVIDSDIQINQSGMAGAFIKDVSCDKLYFENNIIYYSKDVDNNTAESDHFINFKLFQGTSLSLGKVVIVKNTFIDMETSYGRGANGMVYANEINDLSMSNNIYYLSYPYTKFMLNDGNTQTKTHLVRCPDIKRVEGFNNYAYSGNSEMQLIVSFKQFEGLDDLIVVKDNNIFSTFDKERGLFTLSEAYKDFGAQR